jgi:hypothetical protein
MMCHYTDVLDITRRWFLCKADPRPEYSRLARCVSMGSDGSPSPIEFTRDGVRHHLRYTGDVHLH